MAIWDSLVETTLSSSVAIAATSMSVVAPASPFNPPVDPGGDTAYLVLCDDLDSPTKFEVVSYTGRTGSGPYTLTGLIKGVEGSDQAWDSGDYVLQTDIATFKEQVARKNQNQVWSKAQRTSIITLTDGATITPDMNDGNDFVVTLGGDRTLANPSNLTAGQCGSIRIIQDGTGSRSLAFGTYWQFAGGTVPTLTTTAGAWDTLHYKVWSTTLIEASLNTDIKRT